jgi:hypothetical protein
LNVASQLAPLLISRPQPDDLEYPSPEVADELVATYFSRIHHTFPILHQQLFIERYTKAMEDHSTGKPSSDHAFLACMFAVFACGASVVGTKDSEMETPQFLGMEYRFRFAKYSNPADS